jgi:hypothetical protein
MHYCVAPSCTVAQQLKKERAAFRSKCKAANLAIAFGAHIGGEDTVECARTPAHASSAVATGAGRNRYIALNSTMHELVQARRTLPA